MFLTQKKSIFFPRTNIISMGNTEAYLGSFQTSMMEGFAKMVNGF